MTIDDLTKFVYECIQAHKETDHWDFKQKWHAKKEDLVKDIICFANTIHDDNCYIIFGVTDSFEVVGISSENRKNQADVLDLLSKVPFTDGACPNISVKTVIIFDKEIDVIVIENVEKTPIYLNKQWGNMLSGCIYARVGDRNTPDKGNAETKTVEMLWKKRFGLTNPPYVYIINHLKNKQEWKETGNGYYYIYKPEYKLENRQEDERDAIAEFYAYTQYDSRVSYSYLDIYANETVLKSFQIVHLDHSQLNIPVPVWGYISKDKWGHDYYSYKYYVIDSDNYKLLQFMYDQHNDEEVCVFNAFMDVILLYDSEEEKSEFEKYVSNHLAQLEKRISNDTSYMYIEKEDIVFQPQLRCGKCLKEMLNEYRKKKRMGVKEQSLSVVRALWECTNEMHAKLDSHGCKNYLLSLLFYKVFSDNQLRTVVKLLQDEEPISLNNVQKMYEQTKNNLDTWPVLSQELKRIFGVVIQPEYTFNAFYNAIIGKSFSLDTLKRAFIAIEQAENTYFKKLFEGFNFYSEQLGATDKERCELISKCIVNLSRLDTEDYDEEVISIAYDFLIHMICNKDKFNSKNYCTPYFLIDTITGIVTHENKNNECVKIYDPCLGTASLVLYIGHKMQKKENIQPIHYYGQEINTNTFHLAIQNCILHNIPLQNLHFRNIDALTENGSAIHSVCADVVVIDPPFNCKYNKQSWMLSDPRFNYCGKLPSKNVAEYTFLLNGLFNLKEDGIMCVILPSKALYRKGPESSIRKHLIDKGYIYSIVQLPDRLYSNLKTPVCLLLLRKNNTKKDIFFVNATKEYKTGKRQNYLTTANVKKIVSAVNNRKNIEGFAKIISYNAITKNNYNLNYFSCN